ncbi:MAG: hypothetical protein IPJ56_09280 [Gemmatimonadetes bacterium]|nr:hypothetical protein [Gemmatimonadota bacterium]
MWLAASALGWTLAGMAARVADALTGTTSARGIAGALLFPGDRGGRRRRPGLVTGAAPSLAWYREAQAGGSLRKVREVPS